MELESATKIPAAPDFLASKAVELSDPQIISAKNALETLRKLRRTVSRATIDPQILAKSRKEKLAGWRPRSFLSNLHDVLAY